MKGCKAKKINQLYLYTTTWIHLTSIMLTQEARSKKHTYCMVPSVHTSKLALVVMIVKTLGEEGGSSDQKKDERRCLRSCNILGLGNI